MHSLSGGGGSAPMAYPSTAPTSFSESMSRAGVSQTDMAFMVYRLGMLSALPLGYHGYKRHNDSLGWGILWWMGGACGQ